MVDTIQHTHDGMLMTFEIAGDRIPANSSLFKQTFLSYGNLKVATRGDNNMLCDEIELDIKNRLVSRLIEKQTLLLYGNGIYLFKPVIEKRNVVREWIEMPKPIAAWLDAWEDLGSDSDYKETAKAIIRRYYTFEDFFIRWRFFQGKRVGSTPVAFFEMLENKRCRLATDKDLKVGSDFEYKDFRFVLVGNWRNGLDEKNVYPRFVYKDLASYYSAAVSHHLTDAVGSLYGVNKFYAGAKDWIRGSNLTPIFLNSYRENSFAAKVLVKIPQEWYDAIEDQVKALCNENGDRKAEGLELLKYNDEVEIGTDFKQSVLDKIVKKEIERFSRFMSGAKNQGKLWATNSYITEDGVKSEWEVDVLDLKSKEYVDAQITYDKRADDVILSSIGIDSSLSNVSKDGVISKSGSDVYYNYLIYINSLTSAEETCLEPFNMMLRMNFPKEYAEGYRFGFYQNVPQKQEDTTPKERLQNKANG